MGAGETQNCSERRRGCCSGPPPVDFDSEEGRQGRAALRITYGKIAYFQIALGAIAAISGTVTIGLAIPNAHWPFVSCFSLINGLMQLGAGVTAFKLGKADTATEMPKCIRRWAFSHYMLSLLGFCSYTSLATTFSGQALGKCFSGDSDQSDDCTPNMDARKAFLIMDLIFAVCLLPVSIFGMGLFFRARKFLYSDPYATKGGVA